MAIDIGPRIGIDGEKEYRDAIGKIIQQAKTLDSEMKVVTASFTDATSEEEKNAKIAEVVAKKIKVQKERVEKLSDMLEKSKKETGEASTETLKWQQALNEARAELLKLENGTKSQTEETEKLKTAMSDGGKEAVSFGALLKANLASEAIKKGLETVVSAVEGIINAAEKAGKAIAGIVTDNAKWADDMLTLSTNTGISVERLQEFEYMAERIDTDLETITDAMAKNIRSMKSTAEVTETATDAGEEYAKTQERIASLTEEVEQARARADRITAQSAEQATKAIEAVQKATFEVERAQISYDNAVAKGGRSSSAAKNAEEMLSSARERLKEAQNDYNAVLAEGSRATEELLIKQEQLADAQTALVGIQAGETKSVNEMTEAYQKLGVAVYDDVTGELRDSEQVFFEVIDALGKIENRTERDALSMTIFGRSAQDLNSLISTGSDTLKEYADEAERTGYVQEKSTLETLAEFSNQIDAIEKKVKQMGTELAKFLAPFVGYILDNAIPMLDSLNEKLTGLFSGEISADEFVGYVIEEIKKIKDKITENLPELIEKGKEIIGAVGNGIAGSLPTLLEGVVDTMKKVIQGAGKVLPDFLKFGADLILTAVNGIAEGLPELTEVLIDGLLDGIKELTTPESLDKIVSSAVNIVLAVAESVIGAIPDILKAAYDIIGNLREYMMSFEWGDDIVRLLLEGIKAASLAVVQIIEDFIIDPIKETFEGFLDDPIEWGEKLVDNFFDGIKSKFTKNPIKDATTSFMEKIGLIKPKTSQSTYEGVATSRQNEMEGAAKGAFASQSYNYGGVSINVYGAEGQSEEAIARSVLNALQSQINNKARVFA